MRTDISLKAPGGTKDSCVQWLCISCRDLQHADLDRMLAQPLLSLASPTLGCFELFIHDISTPEASEYIGSKRASLGPVSAFMMMESFVSLAASEPSSISRIRAFQAP